MWKRRSKSKTCGNEALFHAIKRGVSGADNPIAAEEFFPSVESIAGDSSLSFDMNNEDGKLFLGLVNGRMEVRGNTRYAKGGTLVGIKDDRHAMIVAGSRAGKGRSLLLPVLATWPGSVICIDPKLDLATETAKLRAERLGQTVHVMDPFNAGGPSCDSYQASGNPMAYVLGREDDDLIDLATMIADGLIVSTQSNDPHWNDTARQFVEAVVLHVLTSPKYADCRNLSTVHDLVFDEIEDQDTPDEHGILREVNTLEAEMTNNPACGGAVMAGAVAYYDKDVRERSSVLSTLRRHVHFLQYPRIKRALADGPVDPRRLHDEPTTIYLGLPATKMRSCAGLPRLFINLALAAFEANSARRDFQHQQGRYPCLLIMDEFFSLGRLDRVEAAAGQIAGFGVKLLPVLQDLSQIKTLYPNSWQTFVANAGVLCFFGNHDLATLEFLEKRLGRTRVYTPSHSSQTYDAAVKGGATGSSYSLANHPLMTISELARTFDRDDPFCRQLVLSAKHGPMILQRATYDQHTAFKKIFNAYH